MPDARSAGAQRGAPALLFDRNGQPTDQARDFVELRGIMVFDRAGQTGKTFIVAHDRHGGWNDRGNRGIGVNQRHHIISRIEPAKLTIIPD
jgi:hypothetical protein